MPKASSAQTSPVRSAERLVAVLSWFNEDHPSGRVSDIAHDLDLAPSTVRRLVLILHDHGYLALDSNSGRYRLHLEVVRLAGIAMNSIDLMSAAPGPIDELFNRVDEPVVLSVVERGVVIQLSVRQSRRRFSIYPPLGRRYLAYSGGATGRVLLAWKDAADLEDMLPEGDEWPAFGAGSFQTRDVFLQSLDETRTRGFAVNDGETDADLWAVAAPIWDYAETVVAALSVAARRSAMSPEYSEMLTDELLKTTREISGLLLSSRGASTAEMPR